MHGGTWHAEQVDAGVTFVQHLFLKSVEFSELVSNSVAL